MQDTKLAEHTYEFAKYVFNDEEKAGIAEKMAHMVEEAGDLEDQKKAVTKDFDGRIQAAKNTVSSCAQKLNSGYEMRDIQCEVRRDYERKVVEYIREDTGEIARSRSMSSVELQQELPFDKAANE